MKPVYEKVTPRWNESFYCEVIRGNSYGTPWHFHPECELALGLNCQGYRMVGDHIASLRPGDLVFVGSNLPHVWHQDAEARLHAIVIQFRADFLGEAIGQCPELAPIQRLLSRAGRGLHITGATRDFVSRKMREIPSLTGPPRLIALLQILDRLAVSRELTPLASVRYAPTLNAHDQSRLGRVCDYINAHLTEPLDRNTLAGVACLSPSAFSRFFKSRTGRTCPDYINELRIARACRLLAEDNQTVTAIAFDCGFHSVPNFQRKFFRYLKTTPRAYRDRLKKTQP